jgi:hypothetical protein
MLPEDTAPIPKSGLPAGNNPPVGTTEPSGQDPSAAEALDAPIP